MNSHVLELTFNVHITWTAFSSKWPVQASGAIWGPGHALILSCPRYCHPALWSPPHMREALPERDAQGEEEDLSPSTRRETRGCSLPSPSDGAPGPGEGPGPVQRARPADAATLNFTVELGLTGGKEAKAEPNQLIF